MYNVYFLIFVRIFVSFIAILFFIFLVLGKHTENRITVCGQLPIYVTIPVGLIERIHSGQIGKIH